MKIINFSPSHVIYATVILSSLTSADIAGKLDTVNEKKAGEESESTVSVLIPFLQNITELVGNIRGTFDKWSQANNLNRLHRQALSGCELIPTDMPNGTTAYFFCDKEMNWHLAQRHCASHGMRLATVDTEDVYNKVAPFVKNFIDHKGLKEYGFWVGASDLGSEGNWYWGSNGQFLKWTKWFPKQPDNNFKGQAENCLALWRYMLPTWKFDWIGFNDYVCDLNLRFICELY